MKIQIGGEIESDLYEHFRIARNVILSKLNNTEFETQEVSEISFYIFLLNNFNTSPQNRYSKKYGRIEIEIVLSVDLFKISNANKRIDIIKESILESLKNYENKNLDKNNIDIIKNRIEDILE